MGQVERERRGRDVVVSEHAAVVEIPVVLLDVIEGRHVEVEGDAVQGDVGRAAAGVVQRGCGVSTLANNSELSIPPSEQSTKKSERNC